MSTLKNNKYIYSLAIAIALTLMPFFFGFPQADGERFYLEDHGTIRYVSSFYYICSLISYGIGMGGIIMLVISIIKLQKDYGFKPRIILVIIDPIFLREMISRIRQSLTAKVIFTVDLILFVVLLFRW